MFPHRVVPVALIAALALAGCAGPMRSSEDAYQSPDVTVDGADTALQDGSTDDADAGPACTAPHLVCSGHCVNPDADSLNCGMCGHACSDGEGCYRGECLPACASGLYSCPAPAADGGTEEICVDIVNGRLNCGACGNVCPTGTNCSGGVCLIDCAERTLCTHSASGDGGAGPTSYCADLQFDDADCGACGHACPSQWTCSAGTCVLGCVSPTTGCPPSAAFPRPYCANLSTDSNNCGVCGRVCPTGQTCTGGTCACPTPYLACGAACIDPNTDENNCGSCHNACDASSLCTAGRCVTCAGTVCGGTACVDTTIDVANCGACDTVCSHGEVCDAGVCTCPLGSTSCSGACSDPQSDANNCGACGNVCAAGEFCIHGACASSITGYALTTPPSSVTFVNACSLPGHTTVLTGVDDGTAPFALPFPFLFYSYLGTAGWVSTNGIIGVGSTANSSFSNACVPTSLAPRNAIFAYWDDLHARTSGICFGTVGTAPNRQFVVTLNDEYLSAGSSTADHLVASVMLNEGTNAIDVIYRTLAGAVTGASATMGVQNASGTMATQRSCNTTGISSGTAVRYQPM